MTGETYDRAKAESDLKQGIEDGEFMRVIASRAVMLLKAWNPGEDFDRQSFLMDVLACHTETPLKLQELFESDDYNFMHDIIGINRSIDRLTGKTGTFRPRFLKTTENY